MRGKLLELLLKFPRLAVRFMIPKGVINDSPESKGGRSALEPAQKDNARKWAEIFDHADWVDNTLRKHQFGMVGPICEARNKDLYALVLIHPQGEFPEPASLDLNGFVKSLSSKICLRTLEVEHRCTLAVCGSSTTRPSV